jgi:dihydrofolate reductase
MTTIFVEMSVSLDGMAAGPEVSHEHPMGVGGRALHYWMIGDGPTQPTAEDRRVAGATMKRTGAFILGRRTFDIGLPLWGDDGAFGRPCFVVTTKAGERVTRGPTTFDLVTGGLREALERAIAMADGNDVCIMGGPTLAREYLAAGLVHELSVHLVPYVLGNGTRLLDELPATRLTQLDSVITPLATHLRYAVARYD